MMPDDLLKPLSDARGPLAGRLPGQPAPGADAGHGRERRRPSSTAGPDRLGRRPEALDASRTARSSARPPGLKQNEFLRSDDGRRRLPPDARGEARRRTRATAASSSAARPLPDGEMKGYQADVGAGWWGKLYEENGRGLLWDKSGEAHVKPGDWNTYEVVGRRPARSGRAINGKPCVDLDDPEGAAAGHLRLPAPLGRGDGGAVQGTSGSKSCRRHRRWGGRTSGTRPTLGFRCAGSPFPGDFEPNNIGRPPYTW